MEPSIRESGVNACPSCGAALPADAPQGLCAKCLLAGAAAPTEAEPGTGGGPRRAPEMEQVAAAFPQLEILGLVGVGGMGAVFKARQRHLDRLVALKILSESLASNPAFVERFDREARVLARLNHPNIVTLHDFGQAGPYSYLLLEYVDGVNLRQAMRAGRMTAPEALALVPKICDALQFAHDEGVLHRDIKPENILLDARGRVKIADFGVAKLLGDSPQDLTLTASGAAMGTPNYMAPEQIETPSAVDHRADIYSLGVVLYEMLTGELPLGRFPAPSARTLVDERVDGIVLRALEKERELRQQSANEVRTQVEGVARGSGATSVSGTASGFGSPAESHAATGGTGGSGGGRAAGPASGVSGVAAARWNRKAVIGAALTGASLVAALTAMVALLLLSPLVRFFMETRGALWALLVAGVFILVTLLVLLPALQGFALGVMALRELRDRTRGEWGRVLAWMAILPWPGLVLLLAPAFVVFGSTSTRQSRGPVLGLERQVERSGAPALVVSGDAIPEPTEGGESAVGPATGAVAGAGSGPGPSPARPLDAP